MNLGPIEYTVARIHRYNEIDTIQRCTPKCTPLNLKNAGRKLIIPAKGKNFLSILNSEIYTFLPIHQLSLRSLP